MELGAFSIVTLASDSSQAPHRARVWGEVGDAHAYARVRDRVLSELQASDGSLNGRVAHGARLVVVQLDLKPPFAVDVVYMSGGCPSDSCETAVRTNSGIRLVEQIRHREDAFVSRLRHTFQLDGKRLDGKELQQAWQ